jgi:hypothetical protein
VILIYLDESGINYKIENGLYTDGPFLIFGAMCINEDVYWNMERLFCELIDDYFKIDNWLENEIHATDIWAGTSVSIGLTIEKRRDFFDEFLQLCGKFELSFVYSYIPKVPNQTIEKKNLDMIKCAQCLLIAIEHKLAELHQTGVLVCDSSTNSESLKIKEALTLDIKQKPLSFSQVLLREFYKRTSWRLTKKKIDPDIKPKYRTEAMSAYLIDRIHFLSSDDSLFLQMCDIMTFIIQRSMAYQYLQIVAPNKADKNKVPFTDHGCGMMRDKVIPCYYSEENHDVSLQYLVGGNIFNAPSLLSDFSKQLIEQYNSIQPNV